MTAAPWDVLRERAAGLALFEEDPPQERHEFGTLWLAVVVRAAAGQAPEVAAYGVRCPDCWAEPLSPCSDRRNGAMGRACAAPHRNRVRKARRRGLVLRRRAA